MGFRCRLMDIFPPKNAGWIWLLSCFGSNLRRFYASSMSLPTCPAFRSAFTKESERLANKGTMAAIKREINCPTAANMFANPTTSWQNSKSKPLTQRHSSQRGCNSPAGGWIGICPNELCSFWMSSNILLELFGKFVRFLRKETQGLSFSLFGVLLVAEPGSILGIQKAACQYPISHPPPGNADHGV